VGLIQAARVAARDRKKGIRGWKGAQQKWKFIQVGWEARVAVPEEVVGKSISEDVEYEKRGAG